MRFPLATRYADYDTKGHVNNAIYLTYFEEARNRAWTEAMGQDADFSFILAEATVRYRTEAMIGEALDIEIRTVEIRTKAWVWEYVIRHVADERVVADGRTVQVMYDYAGKCTVPIPITLRERLAFL